MSVVCFISCQKKKLFLAHYFFITFIIYFSDRFNYETMFYFYFNPLKFLLVASSLKLRDAIIQKRHFFTSNQLAQLI